jgi:hypothetical protein
MAVCVTQVAMILITAILAASVPHASGTVMKEFGDCCGVNGNIAASRFFATAGSPQGALTPNFP